MHFTEHLQQLEELYLSKSMLCLLKNYPENTIKRIIKIFFTGRREYGRLNKYELTDTRRMETPTDTWYLAIDIRKDIRGETK